MGRYCVAFMAFCNASFLGVEATVRHFLHHIWRLIMLSRLIQGFGWLVFGSFTLVSVAMGCAAEKPTTTVSALEQCTWSSRLRHRSPWQVERAALLGSIFPVKARMVVACRV